MRTLSLALAVAVTAVSLAACKPGGKSNSSQGGAADAAVAQPKVLVPTNPELRAALSVYAQDAGARPLVIEALVKSLPLLAVDAAPPAPPPPPLLPDGGIDTLALDKEPMPQQRFLLIVTDGGTLIPAFTDLDALRAFAPDAGYTALRGDELIYTAKFGKMAGVLLNIASKERMEITAREVDTISQVLPPPVMKPMRDDFEAGDGGAGLPKHEGHEGHEGH